MSLLLLERIIHRSIPSPANVTYTSGCQILFWRKNLISNRIGE